MVTQQKTKKCARCGVEHKLSFFRKDKAVRYAHVAKSAYHSICKKCEIEERIAKRKADPFTPKAQRTISYHAKKRGMTARQFCETYDLSVDYIASLFRDAWRLHELGGHCHSCEKPFDNNLETFELDIIFRDKDPTRSNLRVICDECNAGKSTKDASDWDYEMAGHRKGEEAIKDGVQFDLPETQTKKVPVLSASDNQLTLW